MNCCRAQPQPRLPCSGSTAQLQALALPPTLMCRANSIMFNSLRYIPIPPRGNLKIYPPFQEGIKKYNYIIVNNIKHFYIYVSGIFKSIQY